MILLNMIVDYSHNVVVTITASFILHPPSTELRVFICSTYVFTVCNDVYIRSQATRTNVDLYTFLALSTRWPKSWRHHRALLLSELKTTYCKRREKPTSTYPCSYQFLTSRSTSGVCFRENWEIQSQATSITFSSFIEIHFSRSVWYYTVIVWDLCCTLTIRSYSCYWKRYSTLRVVSVQSKSTIIKSCSSS